MATRIWQQGYGKSIWSIQINQSILGLRWRTCSNQGPSGACLSLARAWFYFKFPVAFAVTTVTGLPQSSPTWQVTTRPTGPLTKACMNTKSCRKFSLRLFMESTKRQRQWPPNQRQKFVFKNFKPLLSESNSKTSKQGALSNGSLHQYWNEQDVQWMLGRTIPYLKHWLYFFH